VANRCRGNESAERESPTLGLTHLQNYILAAFTASAM
jgi:hypothetical protein